MILNKNSIRPKATIIVNPASRSGLKVYRQLSNCIDRYFKHEVFFTKNRGHAIELAHSSVSDVIIVCGGDGTTNYAGGMKVSPHSDPLSNRARMLLLKWMKKIIFLMLFPRVYSGTHVNVRYVEDMDARRIDILTPGLPVDVEGEYVGITPCTFMISDEYIRFV
ncbi:MAG: diacylglycerol kinase family protein [Spirochaetota bacterium]